MESGGVVRRGATDPLLRVICRGARLYVKKGIWYNIRVQLKVEGPKKPSKGTIGNDADLIAGNSCWS